MSEIRTYFPATAASTLRVEFRSDGAIRFRIQVVGQPGEAVVDLGATDVHDLIDTMISHERRTREERS